MPMTQPKTLGGTKGESAPLVTAPIVSYAFWFKLCKSPIEVYEQNGDSVKNEEISEEEETHNATAGSAQKETENHREENRNRDIQYHVDLAILTSMSEDNRSTEDVFLENSMSKDNRSTEEDNRSTEIVFLENSMSEDNRSTEDAFLEKHFRYVRGIYLTFSKGDIAGKIISLKRRFNEVMNEHGNDPQMDRCVE
ncbi:hypothetical protein KY290_011929 [Solanum tuberosum]|uniref:Uncharacterized protein n=1 Tax=Solanum tuberosum TaxID=4113 RepID=A0ABQ7W244_SOLTU|nr:hypothetical protein KY289_012452 [Solanum tuberosum]KAH0710588.1 hypothetical protein KY284_012015 [Solanum tuberosum]KAH0736260.1 hypothetical protein KY285_011967 [Solanum tuberosum]KAH0774792.1 hypothetical protein KY290_011929 [Solanum tuberosum]